MRNLIVIVMLAFSAASAQERLGFKMPPSSTADLADNSVTAAKIAANAVLESEINWLGVTSDSMAYMVNRFLMLPASAWLSAAANGATDSTVSYIPAKSFSASTAETLSVDFILPRTTSVLDSIIIYAAVNQTTGDSLSFDGKIRAVALTGAINSVAFTGLDAATVDMGATANAPKRFAFAISSTSGVKRVTVVIWRDPSIANDQSGRGYIVDAYARGKALR